MSSKTTALDSGFNRRFGVIVGAVAAIVGLIYGYDNGSINGALPFLTKQFSLSSSMQGAVLSTTVFGSIIGAIIGGRTADVVGRKKMMLMISLGYAIFALFSAIPIGIEWLLAVRFCMGLTIGTSIVAAPLFIAEFAPTKNRGSLLVSFQIAQTIGIIVANFVDYGYSFSGNWEFMLGASCVPAFIVAIALYRFPDTPRWYLMKGYRDKAKSVLKLIEPLENLQNKIKEIDIDLNTTEGKVRELFQKRFSRATFFVIGFGFLGKISGIAAITHYAPIIFKHIGLPTSESILVSAIVQISAFVAEIVAFFIVDRIGRRPTLLTGFGLMVISAAVMAVLFFQNNFEGAGIYFAFFSIMGFNMAFNFSFGSLVWVYASECFPARLRSAGSSVLLTSDLVGNLIVAQLFPIALSAFGGSWTFMASSVLSLVGWFFMLLLAPETKGRSLEEIHNYWDNGGRWPDQTK